MGERTEDYFLVKYNKTEIDKLIKEYERKMVDEYNKYLEKHVQKIKEYNYDLKIEFGSYEEKEIKKDRRFYDSYYSGIYCYVCKDDKKVYYNDGEPEAYDLFCSFGIARIEKHSWSKGKNIVYFIHLNPDDIEEEFNDIYKCLEDKEHLLLEK